MIIKFIKKKVNSIKICAVFTTVCFVVSTLGANLYAIPLAENANKKYEDVFNKVSSISAEYGKITASKDANSDITIINIQDLHCHPQTQRNISKIITQIADKYNLKKIYVEGGYGDIDTSWLNSIKDEQLKKQIIEKLLEEGILTGSEYYKLTNNSEVELKGIDKEQIHKDNVRRLSWIIENQDKYKDIIEKVEKEINTLEKMYVNSRNERFNRDIEKYLTNEIDSRRFYRQLVKYVKDINANPDKYNNITAIRLEDYPNILKFIALRKTSKDIDVKEVTQQLQMVINELKNKLPYNVYTRLLSETENFSDSQKVVELITMLCAKEGINLENKYEALKTFLESNDINRQLNTVELVQEERQLLSEIRKALSYNNEEYEITFVSDFSRYFKDYLEYKLTDADWKYFEKEYDQFRTLYSKYAVVDRIEEISGDFEEINKYYKINDQRNDIFVSNLLKDEEISMLETDRVRQEEEILKDSKEVIIAVTGGFHSSELEEILAKKEVNTIVITPSIFEGIEKATKQYKGIIKEQSKYFQHQALAYTLASCTTDEYKKNLLYSMAKDLLGGNVERLREALGQDVDLTVFDNLQPLTEQEQEQISEQKNIIVSAASDIAADVLPKEGGKAIFVPNVSEIILKVSRSLVDAGIFLNNGPVFAAEELGLPNLDDISPEEYSRMPDSIQEALVAKEYGTEAESDERANEEENFAEESIDETEDVETLVEEETVDSSYLSEERKSELLKKLNNDREALDLLIDICCRKSVNFDLSKDSALLEMFIRKLNLGEDYLDFDYMYDIVKRSIHVANTFPIDTDLKFACFEKFIDFFNSEDKNKNGEVYYITLFRRLFSLNKKSLQFFYETLDGLSANDLVFYYDASKINKNLKFLLENFDKGIYEITDYSRLVNLFDNIDKLSFLSEGEFSYLISLPNKIFVSVLYSSTDSFQLKTKLTVGKKYYYKGCDEDVARAIFDKAEKLQGLNVVFYPAFSRLNKEAIIYILDNVNNSFEIEKILSMYRGMGLSPEFENTIRLKDFKDPRFKALVKYISSIQDRDFYDKLFFGIYDRENLRNIVNSIDDANFVKDYLLNPDYQKIYKNLFKKLTDLNIKNVAAENNHLALKLILNKEFNQILTESGIDNISDEDNIIARYYSAIAVSRMIFDGVGGEKIDYDFNDEAGMELIKEVTDTYLEIMKEMLNVVLLDSDTKIYALCNSERVYGRDRFNIDTLQEIIEYMGIQLEIPEENVYRRVGNNKNASKGWLNAIETFVMDSIRTKGYFMFRGHGNENMLWVYDPKEKDNGLATGNMLEVITPRELAESLFKLATRDQDPVDLRNITIDLSSCYSYYFARSVYNILEQKFKAENKTESYPTIITAAGLETEFGITDFRGMEGNLHKGINKLLRNFQRGSVPALTLGMVGVSEYMFSDSNITMFSSFFDEKMLEKIAKTRESIAKFNISRHRTVETEPDILDNIEQTATRVNIRNAKKIAIRILPKFVTELSVFRADKTAPLWEELVYRAIPTLALTALLIASTMFLPAVPVVAVIAKLTCIGIFSLVQVRFIKAHIVTDWLKAMDAGGPVNLKDVFEDKSLTGREKINKTIEIIKKRILVIFPNSKEERSFYRFYTRNKQAISHREGLIIPTIVFSLPYLAAIIFFNSMPVVAIATVISMALHFINNEIARTLEEKEKLKEKQSSVKFLDIQKRLSHVELLIDNPQMKMDLPEIRVGRLALMFGLETINERRTKNLSDYEKVRDSFINRLEPENLQKQKESIEKELSRIEGKKRKTKKDKEKIAELKEKLEIIEKEYPEIRAELLSADTKKVEKIIDSINSLLPIFEEIEGILEEIEFFREVNGDTEETRELEREFLDFTEQTLMRELMSLYDANVTGLHVRRVVAFSKLIGSNMPFGNNVRMMYNLMLSSILHDIGKNLVPGTILNKQGSFDDLERDIMDFHVVFGGFILRSSILKNLSYTAENHHYTTKNSPRSYSFDSKMGYEHEAADYEEAQIAKIVTLTDVYEAVSPKLSFSTERTYQFPRKIRDISDMLENISAEVDLTEFQKKEVIVLLAEIAQIDSEEDAAKKQEMEQAFIKKVLYDRSRNFVINYVREKNYDFVRANAFKIVFTKSPQEVFKELGKTEEEFMYDFESDPEGTIDRCMSLVSEFEFDTAVVRAFLEFYFSSEDININDEIIESLNKEKESAFIVYMKNLSYSLYKMFRRARFIMVRFAPVIASISSESQTDYDKYFKDKKVFLQRFKIEEGVKKVRSFEILKFGKSAIQRVIGRFAVPVFERDYDSLGMIVEKDSDGNIVSVKAKEGYGFSSLSIDGEPVGDEKNNLNFSAGQISAMLKDVQILDYNAPDIKEDEMDKYVAHIYLDDSKEDLGKAMEDAIKNNKLMVIHVFRKGFSTKSLTLGQIRDKYDQAYSLLQSDKLKNLPILSETMQLEKDVEVDPYITFDFFLKELLKNHFGHGNFGLFEYPIACYISADGSKMVTYDSSLDLGNGRYSSPFLSEEFKNRGITIGVLDDLMKETLIHGDGKGRKMMEGSKTRNFEDSRRVDDSRIAGSEYRFFKATVTLKLETEEQIEAAKQYKKEQDAKARTVTSSSAVDEESGLYSFGISTSKTSSTVSKATAEDWEDFWSSILKPFGLKLGNYAHVWEEVVFRYLPTVFILLGYINPLVGLGIQIVFILAHPLAKWMAARMNWEKAKKEGKQVGEKAGIGDLFKQVGKDVKNLIIPTLTLMLPYAGSLITLAINPALSVLITPALITFGDVIVKWLTRKDSGGISINKNLIIVSLIASLVSYTLLPFIPAVRPLVNALINPIVITNTVGAVYLHYEYNKRQQERSKLLNIASNADVEDEDEDEDVDISDQSVRAKNRVNSGTPINVRDFFNKVIGVIYGDESTGVFKLSSVYNIEDYTDNTEVYKRGFVEDSDNFYEMDSHFYMKHKLMSGCVLYDSENREIVNPVIMFSTKERKFKFMDANGRILENGTYRLANGETEFSFDIENDGVARENIDASSFFDKEGIVTSFNMRLNAGCELVTGRGVVTERGIDTEVDFVAGTDFEVRPGETKYIKIRNTQTNQEIIVKINLNRRNNNPQIKVISATIPADTNLREYGIESFILNNNVVSIVFSGERRVRSISATLPSQDGDFVYAYDEETKHLFRFGNGFIAPKQIFSLEGITNFSDIGTIDRLGNFTFNSNVSYFDITRGFRVEDFKNKNFVIKRKDNDPVMLYFDSNNGKLYKVTDHLGTKTEIGTIHDVTDDLGTRREIRNLEDYGIQCFSYTENGEITELILENGADMKTDVRQPKGIEKRDICARMEEFAAGVVRNLDGSSIEDIIPILKMACPSLTDEELEDIRIDAEGHIKLSDGIKNKLRASNYQGEIALEDIDFSDEERLMRNPIIHSMFIEALVRTLDALQVSTDVKINESLSFDELMEIVSKVIDGEKIDRNYFEKQLRGYFGEIYCTKTIIAGEVDGIKLRLQMPDASNEPGIDLIDPVTGMKIQVKTGKKKIVDKHLEENWEEEAEDYFFKSGNFGHKMIPVLTVTTVKTESYDGDSKVQSFGLESATITGLIERLLGYGIDPSSKILAQEHAKRSLTANIEATGVSVSGTSTISQIRQELEEQQARNNIAFLEETAVSDATTEVTEPVDTTVVQVEETIVSTEEESAADNNLSLTGTDDGSAILPENMGLVNKIMQSRFGNAFIAATVIAFREFKASLEPDFVNLHQTAAGRRGAQQVASLTNRYNITKQDSIKTKIVKSILGIIFKGASIVKHIAIDYRYIKASGIQEAISMFGNNTYMDEYGQIHIPPVLIVNDLKGLKNLNNTGIKVNGRYIYQVGQKGMLIYGAEGVNSEDISMAVNESQMIKDAIEQMIREKGYEGVSVEVDGVIQGEGEGVRFENGITIIGTDELQNKSADYIDGYVSSSIELKRSMGVMYSQKALISLESIDDTEKLRQALKQGRARKIISKAQYDQLQMPYEELMTMREAGIEIYVDSNEIDENLKKAGITGQIIRKDNQIFIHDYYTQEDVEVEEVGENNSLTDIENMLVNSQKLILIDIKVLANKFQKENILGAYKGLNTLIGNIKLKTGIGQLSETDIKSLGYNLDYNKLPQLTLSKPLQEYTKAEIEDMLTASILSMDTNTEIRIILKAIDKNDALKDLFTQIIKERILAKTALTQNYKEFGLRDKKLEILLGQMLFMQMDNKNKATIDLTYIDSDGTQKEVTGKENDLINKITQDTEKAMRKDEVAINSIIEIILVYGDSYKDKQMAKQLDVNDARNYRAMMAAA